MGSLPRQVTALSKATALTQTLETADAARTATAMDNFITAVDKFKSLGNSLEAKYDKLYKWHKVHRSNFVKQRPSMAFSTVFGIAPNGLYYQIFNDARLLNKLQALDIIQVEAFFNKIKALNLSADAKLALQGDLLSSDAFLNGLVDETELLSMWKLLNKNERTGLSRKIDALQALQITTKNTKLKTLGFTDDLLAQVRASRLDEGDFTTIMADLDAFGNKMANNPTVEFDNFSSLIGKLTDRNPQNSQAAQWILQDITENTTDFIGKKWKFEVTVTNSDGNAAFIDANSNEIPPMRIEYKWLTIGTVDEATFVREFIKRDLFNTTDLTKLQWRIKGNKLTKDKVIDYLSSVNGRESLKHIEATKANSMLNRTDLKDLTDIQKNGIADAFIEYFNEQSNFDKIFF